MSQGQRIQTAASNRSGATGLLLSFYVIIYLLALCVIRYRIMFETGKNETSVTRQWNASSRVMPSLNVYIHLLTLRVTYYREYVMNNSATRRPSFTGRLMV